MKKFLVVELGSLQILSSYSADEVKLTSFTYPLNDLSLVAHLEVPAEVHQIFCKPQLDENDQLIVVDDMEAAMQALRTMRNMKLAACDHTQLADSPLSSEQKAAWATYRQQLRDLTETVENVLNPTWPVKP